jgi:uncharacterized protein (TIGR00369 family)
MTDKPPSPAATLSPDGLPEPRVGKPSGFRALVGYHALVWRQNYAEIELELGPLHGNSIGMTHGGVLMTLLDAAMGHASTYTPVKGNVRAVVTLSMTTTFLEGPRSGTIRAIARLVSIDNGVATCEAEIRNADGKVMCIAQGSFRYIQGSEGPEGIPKAKLRR